MNKPFFRLFLFAWVPGTLCLLAALSLLGCLLGGFVIALITLIYYSTCGSSGKGWRLLHDGAHIGAMVLGVVVSWVVESIGLVGWVGLEASVGVVIACHGSGGRAGGLRSSRGARAERARMKL